MTISVLWSSLGSFWAKGARSFTIIMACIRTLQGPGGVALSNFDFTHLSIHATLSYHIHRQSIPEEKKTALSARLRSSVSVSVRRSGVSWRRSGGRRRRRRRRTGWLFINRWYESLSICLKLLNFHLFCPLKPGSSKSTVWGKILDYLKTAENSERAFFGHIYMNFQEKLPVYERRQDFQFMNEDKTWMVWKIVHLFDTCEVISNSRRQHLNPEKKQLLKSQKQCILTKSDVIQYINV